MSIMGVGFDLSKSAIKVADSALESVEKFATKKIKSSPDSSHKLMSALEQKAQYWQTKLTPGKLVGEAREMFALRQKLDGELQQKIQEMGLDSIGYQPCFSGPDRYDDLVNVAGKWYDTLSFVDTVRKMGDDKQSFLEKLDKSTELTKKLNPHSLLSRSPFYIQPVGIDPKSTDIVDQMLSKYLRY